ncbi:MAG: acyl-CoA dehydrogenase family protein [Chloroflexi bacterium]|nr:acyl-CoA dehydrogenase family protein [Chloroflexota bacterium]MCH8283404.1 acyl-CoA dehydrogenase family protein [Chloroflexota bacterium]
MDFSFTVEEDAFRQEVTDFIDAELPPELKAGGDPFSDEHFEATMTFRRKMGAKKWIGIGWPTEYGGLGATPIMQMIFHEEMVYRQAPLDPQAYQVGPAIISHGSEYLKKKFLAGTANQEIFWCQGFSEPNAGSDLASVQTRATADGDDYVVSGQKIWTSMAHVADWIHILTRTDPDAPKHRGISYFVMDMKSPGITIRPLVDMLGHHHFNEVFFDNVRVPKANMIGEENRGWYVATTTLDNERSGIRDVAEARRAFDNIVETMREMRGVAGIRRDPIAIHALADLRVMLEVSKMLSYRVGWMQDAGLHPNMEASSAKLFATELTGRIVKVGMEVAGLFAQVEDGSSRAPLRGVLPAQYLTQVSRTIAAGSSEIQRNIIATRGLGLPRG